jgi:hypothetical protein
MKAGLKQAWENYQKALKEFDCPRCGHCCREWQGLTDDEVRQIALDTPIDGTNFARAIEAALKEKNK